MRIIFILFFSLIIQVGFCQLVTLNDINLTEKLKDSYSQVMQGNLLDTVKAATLTGALDLRYSGIVDATGVEYFKGINTLDIGTNQLAIVPNLSKITGLINFYATNNNLTSLPDMSTLHLVDFQVSNNKLTALPNLSGSTGLVSLYCSNNNLTQFPPISQFPQLRRLVSGQNPISASFIDVTPCIQLIELHVHRTGINTIIGLEKLTSLTTLYAWTNNITSFRALDLITPLTICVIFDNPFSEMPFMQNKPALNMLNVYGALLTFEDIQPVLLDPPATFIYTPQREIPFADITARADNNYTISYPVPAPLSTNRYVWIKNGVVIDSSASASHTFTPLKSTDAGAYQLKVYNTSITTLILNTNTFNITVLPCIELQIPSVDIVSKDCSKGYTIDFSQNQISGGTPPFTYELVTNSTRKNTTYPLVENIEAGNYFLKVVDSKLCSATDDFTLNRIDGCDPVITPNGDGITDTYFIEKKGKVSVYDLHRALVNTLQGPIIWDGTDRNGILLDAGLYILIAEGEKPIYLTIIR
jgi:Leucine-rich repeat (LRR) protein